MIESARDFLEAVSGGVQPPASEQRPASYDRPVRLATIDAAYTGVGLPKVLFDGEATMGSRGYAYLNGSAPIAGARVALLPVGQSFVIVGRIGAPSGVEGGRYADRNEFDINGGVLNSGTTTVRIDRVAVRPAGYYRVNVDLAIWAAGNCAGYVQIKLDGVLVGIQRRFHSQGRTGYLWPNTSVGLYLDGASHSIQVVVAIDGGGGGVEAWNGLLRIEAA